MRRIKVLAVTAMMALALTACGAKEKLDEANIADDLSDRGTRELLEEAAEDNYEPPADGRLSANQIDMYMKVREHEKKIADVARKELEKKAGAVKENEGKASLANMMDAFSAVGSMADIATADIRAAKDLGFNTAEYQWVKQQVLGAAGWELTRKSGQALQAMMDTNYAQLKKQHDEATDATTKQMLATMLQEYDKQKAETAATASEDPEAATNEYNYQLISKRSDAATIFAYEMSKWSGETKEEIEKNVTDYNKQLDETINQAPQSN